MSSFDLRQCSPACHQCVKNYIKKFKLKKGDSFSIPCTGIPLQYISDDILATLGEEPEGAIAMLDPVAWANRFLDWHCVDPDGEIWKRKTNEGTLPPNAATYEIERAREGKSIFHRPYQAEMLKCSSIHKVFRIGRQAGKSEVLCIVTLHAAWTNKRFKVVIITPYQAQIDMIFGRITDMIQSNTLLANSVARNVKAPNYQIRLHNGSQIMGFSCVAGTRIICIDGVKNIEDLTVKDIVLSYNTEKDIFEHLPITEIFLPNYKDIYEVLLKNGRKVTVSKDHPFWTPEGWVKLEHLQVNDKVATTSNYKLSHQGKTKCDDLGYLLGLILGDGNITDRTLKKGGPRFTSKNLKIQRNFEDVLKRLCIPYRSQIHTKTGSKEYTIYKRYPQKNTRAQDRKFTPFTELLYSYKLAGCKAENKYIPLELFNRSLEFKLGLLQGLLETDGSVSKQGCVYFYSISERLAYDVSDLLSSFGILNRIRKRKQAEKEILINTEQRVIYCKHDIYEVAVNSKYHCKKLFDIIDLSAKKNYQQCYDLVAKTKQITTADTFKFSRIASISYKGKDITYDIAVGNGTNNFLANGIILHNTAGTRSGQEAGASRGQPANMLVFDEADYLAPGDINAALATIANFPSATVWMSSTPTGKRERFYSTCNNKLYKEFYYPSQINPNWTEEQDAFFRSEFTEEGYRHEILAEFGQQEEGVYQIKYVEAAQSDFEYEDMKPNHNFVYMMGVDWNDQKIGTTIAVVGFNPLDGCFYLVNKCTVSRGNWTQLAACNKIAEMNRLWRPEYIYVDRGYGACQIEILHKRGLDALRDHGPNHPDARLRDIVKGYDFGGSVEIRDLFTQQLVKKPAKPFLVENSVRRFESLHFKYPKSDERYTAQLLGYIIKRTATSGRPVYEQQDEKAGDHLLDAVNLALAAFALEKSQFGKPTFTQRIAVTGRFGEENDVERFKNEDKKRDKYKPRVGRAVQMEKDTRLLISANGDIPAANTNLESFVGIWRWPGFGHDAPRPEARSLTEAFRQAEQRVYNRRTRRKPPKRAKF